MFIPSIYAFKVYLRPARMFLRVNVTANNPGVETGFLEIKNLNNVTMNVELQPTGDIVNITKLDQSSITLEPNETTLVNFTVETKKTGTYSGKILVTYSVENEMPARLQSDIIVIASGEDTRTFSNRKVFMFSGICILVFILLIILLRRGR